MGAHLHNTLLVSALVGAIFDYHLMAFAFLLAAFINVAMMAWAARPEETLR